MSAAFESQDVTLPDARSSYNEVLEALSLHALPACELKFTEADVADGLATVHCNRKKAPKAVDRSDNLYKLIL
jgi:hypothetical protein